MITYEDYLMAGNTPLYPVRPTGRVDGDVRHRCDCGGYAFAQIMVDVRSFDIGGDFACDGCISHWERTMEPINSGDVFLHRHEWRAKFAERRLGRIDPQAETVRAYYLEKEIKLALEKEMAYSKASQSHPDKVRLKARRIALESRRP